jgi:NAD(P)H-dependent FMN reductase
MPNPLDIHIIVGSVREGRMALPVARWVAEQMAARDDLNGELIDLREWALPFFAHARPPAMGGYTDPLQIRWAEKIAAADGYLLIAPEYNHGTSAVLKNALDTVYAEWGRKPVSFVSYGGVGGARSVEMLRLSAVALEMAPLSNAVHLMGANARRDGDRFLGDDKDGGRLAKLFDELAWWGNALRTARGG